MTQEPVVQPKSNSVTADVSEKDASAQNSSPDIQMTLEKVTVVSARLYGDWKMVLPKWPGFDTPVIGDFCNFKKHDQTVSIICADGFLQVTPTVTFDENKLTLRWGGSFTNTTYKAVWEETGDFDGEITQASLGIVNRRFKARMERVAAQPVAAASTSSLKVLNNYFDDLAQKSIREKYYEEGVYNAMKKAVANRAYSKPAFTAKYFGQLLHQDGRNAASFPDVFKVSNAENAEQWCLVRINAEGLAVVRCVDIP